VVDRPQPRPRHQYHRRVPAREQVGEQQVAGDGHQHAAGPLDHQRPLGRKGEPVGVDDDAVDLGGTVRGTGGGEPIGFGEDARG
jgi:hypothetical protein